MGYTGVFSVEPEGASAHVGRFLESRIYRHLRDFCALRIPARYTGRACHGQTRTGPALAQAPCLVATVGSATREGRLSPRFVAAELSRATRRAAFLRTSVTVGASHRNQNRMVACMWNRIGSLHVEPHWLVPSPHANRDIGGSSAKVRAHTPPGARAGGGVARPAIVILTAAFAGSSRWCAVGARGARHFAGEKKLPADRGRTGARMTQHPYTPRRRQ